MGGGSGVLDYRLCSGPRHLQGSRMGALSGLKIEMKKIN